MISPQMYVFKAKYLPHRDQMKSPPKTNSSAVKGLINYSGLSSDCSADRMENL